MARPRTQGVALAVGRTLLTALLVSCLLSTPSAASSSQGAFSGLVKDGFGNGLEGVRVLVLPVQVGSDPRAETWTTPDGRFSVRDLEPGLYRVAAVKEGYRGFLGHVNTLVRSSLDLVLDPLPDTDGKPLPADDSWTLRLPRRSLLREVGGDSLLVDQASRGGSAEAESPQARPMVEGRLEQLFAVAGGLAESSDGALDFLGDRTRLSLATPLLERGSLVLKGYRERRKGETSTEEIPWARQDGAALELDVAYDTSLDARLAVKAYYAQGSLEMPAGMGDLTDVLDVQEQRTWGYDASWSKQLDDSSRFQVNLDYEDSSILAPTLTNQDGPGQGITTPAGGISNRMVGAGGSFESSAGKRHQVKVGVRAQLLALPVPMIRAAGEGALFGNGTAPGLNLRLDAEDAWALSGPLTFVYRLGYRHNLRDPGSALVVPSAGAVWSGDGLHLRVLVSYHTSARDLGSLPSSGSGILGPPRPLGYDLVAEAPLPFGLRVRGARSYEPVQHSPRYEDVGWQTSQRPVYLTDGQVASQEDSLLLERQFGSTWTYLRLVRGSAEGTVVGLSPMDVPVHILAERALRFDSRRFGVRMAASGTEILAEHQRIDESLLGSSQEYWQLRVAQNLIWLERGGASWKLLLTARTASDERTTSPSPRTASLSILNRELSAGVAVAF